MHVEERPSHSIRPAERNPGHNDQAVAAVAASIREFRRRQELPGRVDLRVRTVAGAVRAAIIAILFLPPDTLVIANHGLVHGTLPWGLKARV
jgi:hypothetical protein